MWYLTLIDLQILKNLCSPGIKPTWSWYMIFLICCILFARILLRIFASLFISDIDLKFSFSVTSLSNPGYFWEWNRALCYYTHKVDLNRDCFVDHVSPNWISPDIPAHTHCSPVYLCLPQIYMVSKDSLVQATIILHLHQSSSFLKDLPSLSLFPFCHHDYQSDHFKI